MKRCIDKRSRLTRSGAAAHTLPKCKYFDTLLFLHDKVSNRETSSNVILPNENGGKDLETIDQEILQSDTWTYSSSSPSVQSPQSSCVSTPSTATASYPTSTQTSSQSEKRKFAQNEKKTTAMKPKKNDMSSTLDMLTMQILASETVSASKEKAQCEEDTDLLFFKSLLPAMHSMPKRKNRLARKKIQDIIFELESSDDDN